ncbi:MAG TPA: hypothetical protein VMZ91_14310 [Candidatus Paceibacterota bacterium]|nr:hypothetical protein [Candidatus Paceibacterota bacterium]
MTKLSFNVYTVKDWGRKTFFCNNMLQVCKFFEKKIIGYPNCGAFVRVTIEDIKEEDDIDV